MTIVRADEQGLARAGRALEDGAAIVVALPPPRAYALAGCVAATVNLAKGRPADQPVGSALGDLGLIAPHVDLEEDGFEFARRLATEEALNLFLPLREGAPAWTAESTSNGWTGIMLAPPDPVRALWKRWDQLYVSSANRTGEAVATTAAAAEAMFGAELLVLDDGRERDPSAASGSATIMRVGRGDRLELVRHGINDAAFDGDTDGYLRTLRHRWRDRRPGN